MLPCLPLLLLMGLPACTGTVDEKLALGAEAGSWVTVTLEEDGVIPHIKLTLQEVKRGKTSQFFGLMGKRWKEYLLSSQREEQLHPQGTHQQAQRAWGLLGRAGPSREEPFPGREDKDHGSE